MTMKKIIFQIAIFLLLPVGMCAQEWNLVWADEFEGDQLDETKWSYMTGDGTEYGIPGWGNNELQYYREENVKVADGMLTITARRENIGGRQFTSGRIRTKDKGDWTYGRIEFRAKMPVGQGLWAAVWMLPTEEYYGGWAASGEIDIMEYLGHETGVVHGTLHYGGQWPENQYNGKSYTTDGPSFASEFHDFAMEWEEGEFRWYVDGDLYQTQSSGWYSSSGPFPVPFNRDFHLLVNLAVGGNWPGNPDASTQFPQDLVLDYIRVYQLWPTGLEGQRTEEPEAVQLGQNFPNPFRASTTIQYRVFEEQQVTLSLYDALGRRVRTMVDEMLQPGTYSYRLDGSSLQPGLYYCKISMDGITKVRRMSRL
jgi:beta-glucanase (GH16 family)